jgi:light-regulated signal transduction histidine kinase (bacteriophytochrome)
MAVLLTDISERKRAEEKLRSARDELEMRVQKRTAELEMRNRELQDFAFIASHDLKEPLRKIQAFGDLVITKSADSLADESLDYLVRMQEAAARMGNLLESLLSYSRVTTKAESFSQVNLAEAARSAVSNLEIRLKETGGRVEIADLPTLEGDPAQIVQLFQNLFSNSLKFRRKAEIPLVRVHSRFLEDRKNDAGEVEIYVEDNGVGFDEKYLDKIFVPFQRLHGREEYEGVGMGLAICRKIAERHGGTINAKSTPGKGSTFIMRLPTNRAE